MEEILFDEDERDLHYKQYQKSHRKEFPGERFSDDSD